ncbi:hypothetical protein P4234_25645 [Pseudomonas aeruginosa]|nr:hypothetical protein [Pseudomonas aeruginosa]
MEDYETFFGCPVRFAQPLFGAAGTAGLPGAAAAPGRRDAAAHSGGTCPGADGRAGR